MSDLWMRILETVLITIIGAVSGILIKFITQKIAALQVKSKNEAAANALGILNDLVVKCIEATNQTIVDELKAGNVFDEAAQKAAFEKTKSTILSLITDECKSQLNNISNDIPALVDNLIEAAIKERKE